MSWANEALARQLMFIIGWISGGGMGTFVAMLLIESWFGTDFNTSFVGGCLWGTFGVITGRFMVNRMPKSQPPTPRSTDQEIEA